MIAHFKKKKIYGLRSNLATPTIKFVGSMPEMENIIAIKIQ